MQHSSSEGLALCVQRGNATKQLAYRGFAETWVEKAIAAGCDPHMRQEPLSSRDSPGNGCLWFPPQDWESRLSRKCAGPFSR